MQCCNSLFTTNVTNVQKSTPPPLPLDHFLKKTHLFNLFQFGSHALRMLMKFFCSYLTLPLPNDP